MVVVLLIMVFAVYGSLHPNLKVEINKNNKAISQSNPFSKLLLKSKAVYVLDVKTNKVMFQLNSSTPLPLASITKLMMAYTAADLVSVNSKITVQKEFLEEEGDTGLLADETWKLQDLLDFSLLVSSNDGARTIASVVGALSLHTDNYDLGRKDFITKMNNNAQKMGLKQTYFLNESGLDENGTSGGYGSAEDIANLMSYILENKPKLLEATKYHISSINSLIQTHVAENTNTGMENIPGLLASKTGYTDLAGGNLAIAFDASIGRPIIVVVLGSTIDGRFDDVYKLVKASLEYIYKN